MKIDRIRMDIDKKLAGVIPSVQWDSNTRFLHINILNGAKAFDLTGCSVKVAGLKPDGTSFLNDVRIINAKEGFIEVVLTEQMNAAAGSVRCDIKIYNSKGVLSTQPFIIDVEPSVTTKAIVSSNEFNALSEALTTLGNIDTKFEALTSEAVAKATEQEIKKQISQGTMANLTIAPSSITENKLKLLPEDFHIDNLINLPTNIITTGSFINNNGGFTSSAGAKHVKISIIPGKEIYIYAKKGSLATTAFGQIQLLDGSGTPIRHLNNNTNNIKDTIDSNARYLALNLNVLNIDYVGSLYVGYSAFSEDKLNSAVQFKSLFGKKFINEKSVELENKVQQLCTQMDNIDSNKIQTLSGSKIHDATTSANRTVSYGNWYGNDYIFDTDIFIESLTLIIKAETIGNNKIMGMMVVDKDRHIIETSNIAFNIENTGISKVTVPINKMLPKGAYIYFKSDSSENCRLAYGEKTGSNIYHAVVPTSGAVSINTVGSSSLDYIINYKSLKPLADVLNGFIDKDHLIQELKKASTNRLYGKKIVAIGDSMVQGHSIPRDQGWLAMIAKRNNMTFVNYGSNGNFMTRKMYGTNKGVVDRFMEMDDDADYIVVFALTNDAAANITIGNNSSTDPLEVKGALNIICQGLLTKYPKGKIMFISPYLRNENYRKYVQALHDVCEDKYGIKVYDNIKHGGICWSNTAQVEALTLKDTYHLNLEGMEYASYKYEETLRTL